MIANLAWVALGFTLGVGVTVYYVVMPLLDAAAETRDSLNAMTREMELSAREDRIVAASKHLLS